MTEHDSDDEDDEERMVAALSSFATVVKTGPKVSQKKQRQNKSKRPIGGKNRSADCQYDR